MNNTSFTKDVDRLTSLLTVFLMIAVLGVACLALGLQNKVKQAKKAEYYRVWYESNKQLEGVK